MSETLESRRAAEPVGPYPHARRAGDLVFLSGIGPRRRGEGAIPGVTLGPDGSVVARDFEAQARATFDNVVAILDDLGVERTAVVDVTVFLTDMAADFAMLNRLWPSFFPEEPRPARTTVEVRRLPTPIDIELKVVVHDPAGAR